MIVIYTVIFYKILYRLKILCTAQLYYQFAKVTHMFYGYNYNTMHAQYPHHGHPYTNTMLEGSILSCLYAVYCCHTFCATWNMVVFKFNVVYNMSSASGYHRCTSLHHGLIILCSTDDVCTYVQIIHWFIMYAILCMCVIYYYMPKALPHV